MRKFVFSFYIWFEHILELHRIPSMSFYTTSRFNGEWHSMEIWKLVWEKRIPFSFFYFILFHAKMRQECVLCGFSSELRKKGSFPFSRWILYGRKFHWTPRERSSEATRTKEIFKFQKMMTTECFLRKKLRLDMSQAYVINAYVLSSRVQQSRLNESRVKNGEWEFVLVSSYPFCGFLLPFLSLSPSFYLIIFCQRCGSIVVVQEKA